MRKRNYSKEFQKQLYKLKGQQLVNVLNKIDEILNCPNLNHYKNLRKPLHKFKRVHINNSYVILFFSAMRMLFISVNMSIMIKFTKLRGWICLSLRVFLQL